MMKALIPQIAASYGVDYVRMPRRKVVKIYEAGETFTPGKAKMLLEGTDVAILASGVLVSEAILAARALGELGYSAAVADVFTIKPVDADCVEKCARTTGCVVTAENHSVIGGPWAARSAEVLGDTRPVPLERVGVKESFGEVGSQDYLMDHFGLRAANIVAAAQRAITRKNG